MSLPLRVLLVVGAMLAVALMLRKIRKGQVAIADATFWLLFGLSLLLLAVFPRIAYLLSDLANVESPSNFVFLYVIAVLLMKVFSLSAQISQLRSKLTFLVQEVALKEAEASLEGAARPGSAPSGAPRPSPAKEEPPCAN